MPRLRLSLVVLSFAFATGACGSSVEEEPSEGEAESEALVTNEEALCPANTDLNPDFRTCENSDVAVGPFPRAMIDKCEATGAVYCSKAYWPTRVAHEIRGAEYCPLGTKLDDNLGVCVDDTHAYGPFSRAMIDFCRSKAGADENACFAMKWRKEWVPTPLDTNDAEPGEISPPVTSDDGEPDCHEAQGYRRGRGFKICVTTVDGKLVEKHTAVVLRRMIDAARRDRVTIHVVSGFRTMEKQRQLYRLYKAGRGALAATPGYSNHQSGTALDLNTSSRGVYAWLTRHADEYGFVRTVRSEKWHWDLVDPGASD
jgi:LAS superfamily LD-carboxypeptidase LdcB